MQPDSWAADNEMSSYQPEHMRRFLERGGLFVTVMDEEKIAGAALCYELPHPDGDDTLYVHELDTHPAYRRQGVGTMLMEEVFRIAKERGLAEVWLATETDNDAANGLYRKLQPWEVEQSVTYTYKVE
jgi:ribosomal protein S18 acetylase RimI-like enzyme